MKTKVQLSKKPSPLFSAYCLKPGQLAEISDSKDPALSGVIIQMVETNHSNDEKIFVEVGGSNVWKFYNVTSSFNVRLLTPGEVVTITILEK